MASATDIQQSMAGLDAKLNSTIQLNSSKVPAQDDVFSLVISAGGTGLDALLETKGLINKTCCLDDQHKGQPTDHVAYLAFDTDSASKTRVSSKETGGAMLDTNAGEYVQMEAPNIAAFLSAEFRSQVPSYISSWLDFSIDNSHTGTAGAGGIRQCGRLLLFQNIEHIRNAVSSAIRTMVSGQKVGALNIYLLAGIAGGTGSGTFLDLAYIARDVAETIAPAKVTTYGYLFMPDVNLSRPMPPDNKNYSSKNGYAALKELDYLMGMRGDRGRFVQRYSANYIIDTDLRPFHYVHLVSSMGSAGYVPGDPYRHGMRAVAQSIVSFVAQEHKAGVTTEFAMKSHYDNIEQSTAQHPRQFPERLNSYLALGTYGYELPVDQILLYVTSLLFEKMNSMFDNEPTKEEVGKAYAALGLAPQALLSNLTGNRASIAPPNVMWEDLFGPNARYNLSVLCDGWINRTTVDVENRSQAFIKGFHDRFVQTTETWFTNPERGPIWVNHLIVLNGENKLGLDGRLSQDFAIAGSQATAIKTQIEQTRQMLAGMARTAQDTRGKGKRAQITAQYVDAVNQYADLHARLVAMIQMQEVYKQCREIILEENRKIFNVVVDVLESLKSVCEENANILVNTERNQMGTHFTWEPLSIPDVSDAIRQAFDAKGDAAQTIANFSRALYSRAYEWSKGSVNVKGFIQDYLDNNLGDIANRSLEDYIRVILRGADLKASVISTLGPIATTASEPLIYLSQNADTGGQFWLLSVPYRCQEILEGFKEYRSSEPRLSATLTIQPSGINNRIFAQSILCAVPLSAYAPLAEYEKVYLSQFGDSGKHLYMGKDENWADLPCPIPYRSRPKKEGAYPAAIQEVEDKQRALFQQCRPADGGFPIIRSEDRNSQTHYELYMAKLPNLDERFSPSSLRDDAGRMDAGRLQEAMDTLENWLKNGLPNRDLSDAVHEVCYPVTVCAIPAGDQPDHREEDAREAFLGEYNNIRRARKELEKYQQVAQKYAEIKRLHNQTVGVASKALHVIQLLVSRVVKFSKDDDGRPFYQYILKDKRRELLRLNGLEGRREAELSRRMDELANDPEPMKRQLAADLLQAAQRGYDRMNTFVEDKEEPTHPKGGEEKPAGAREKKRRLEGLLEAVEKRCDHLREDVMNGTADEGVDRDMVTFYERMISRLNREVRDIKDIIENGGDNGVLDEF